MSVREVIRMCSLQEAEDLEKEQSRRVRFMYLKSCQVEDGR